jgi:predicted nucleic acid-binding protein
MVHLDTSVLVDGFTIEDESAADVRAALDRGVALNFSVIVLFEWLRGPRQPEEVAYVDTLFPRIGLVPFLEAEAVRAAEIYKALKRPRSREIDLEIAACALTHGAKLWTLNPQDFDDIPGLSLYRP